MKTVKAGRWGSCDIFIHRLFWFCWLIGGLLLRVGGGVAFGA